MTSVPITKAKVDVEPPPPRRASILADLLLEPISVVDVGCRWGFAAMWERLGPRCRMVGFDPDVLECTLLQARYAQSPHITIVPEALGGEPGTRTLYITENPVGTSLYPTVTETIERHHGLAGGKVIGTESIELTTLDTWCQTNGLERVDVIKIDTQGCEFEILQGAEHVLGSVRALEVEVEFNPLYEGIPLFGDIDRFLRERGFVLWRLRDLAHYAQRGMQQSWNVDAQYYDEFMTSFDTGSGQLFWCNAYYVHRDVAYPGPGMDWVQLVRDACVTEALGFRDLAALALGRARATAPPDVLPQIEVALAEVATAGEGKALTDVSAVLAGSMYVEVDDPEFRGFGWQPPQQLESGASRWTGPSREASIHLPVILPPGSRIELLVVAAMSPEIQDTLALEVNDVPVPLQRSLHENAILHTGVLPPDYSSDRGFTRLLLRTAGTRPWKELHPQSADEVNLGVALSWVRLTAPSG